jgi:hypothetical protein
LDDTLKTSALDDAKLNSFANKVFEDLSGTYVSLLCAIGDRLNIFKNLAANGPATSKELASRAEINERYAREWLSAIYCAGYLEYDPTTQRFSLPPEHAEVLTHEDGPAFVGGAYQGLLAEVKVLDKLVKKYSERAEECFHRIMMKMSGLEQNGLLQRGLKTCLYSNGFLLYQM